MELEYDKIAKGTIVRSKVQFYEEGEKCTKYFLNLEKSNKIKSTVRKLRIENEDITDPSKIMKHIKTYYETKYSRRCNCTEIECSTFLNNVKLPCISEDQALLCDKSISSSEVLSALKCMKNGKSPGNDGLPKEFYVKFFDVI